MIERLVLSLIAAMVALWVVGWLLVHFGLLVVAGLGFGAWTWWRNRHSA